MGCPKKLSLVTWKRFTWPKKKTTYIWTQHKETNDLQETSYGAAKVFLGNPIPYFFRWKNHQESIKLFKIRLHLYFLPFSQSSFSFTCLAMYKQGKLFSLCDKSIYSRKFWIQGVFTFSLHCLDKSNTKALFCSNYKVEEEGEEEEGEEAGQKKTNLFESHFL